MSRQLWLLRHGDAEPHGARVDAQRALTPRGEQQATAAGRAMSALQTTFAAAFTSPKVRARDTAVLACQALGIDAVEDQSLASGFGVDDAIDLLNAAADGERVLVVGHEPDFSQVVHDLTGARVDMKKGGIAAIRVDVASRGELITLLRPRELTAIGGSPLEDQGA
jgi:phosphohistidine phosphatase